MKGGYYNYLAAGRFLTLTPESRRVKVSGPSKEDSVKRLLVLAALFAWSGLAADIAGLWKATAEGPRGTMERTFLFKVDGEKLTGETTSPVMGKSAIVDGKVVGNNVYFTIIVKFQGNEMKVIYKGQVNGNEIKLTAENADSSLILEWRGKKVS